MLGLCYAYATISLHYIRMSLSNMIHPERTPLLLTTGELTKAIPDFNWKERHSGEMLNDVQSAKLDEVWQDYIERTHVDTRWLKAKR